jgi:hypothetical protein
LFAIWINCHSSFIFGVAVSAVVLACSFIEFRLGWLASARWAKCDSKMLAIAFTLSMLALFANPIGPKLLWYPFDTMLNQPVNVHTISEWQQPSLETIRGLALLTVAALILLAPLLRRCKLALHELILVALGFGFAVRREVCTGQLTVGRRGSVQSHLALQVKTPPCWEDGAVLALLASAVPAACPPSTRFHAGSDIHQWLIPLFSGRQAGRFYIFSTFKTLPLLSVVQQHLGLPPFRSMR